MSCCERCREAVSASLDGEDRPQDSFVLDHLRRCPDCRVVADRLMQLHEAFRCQEPVSGVDLSAGLLAARAGGVRASRPCCAGTGAVLYVVGNAACGCIPGCACGCQDGTRCRCSHEVA
ncbi:hypothetical protein XF36_24055 [Pseudonocardia sp. HH130629-09]|nr:hypothetical protein XF36_24055 [Pseudonocardia sp. HH130629-09]